ncbi:hypothetical protein R2083_07285 [Nitrosomonas sp. Is35]|uniref:hypothetical protein n=1 Tax=Nitrosomonas sp. Is35 TaxID=3080534 RepID=UPI00294B0BBC|nr:hypothetical protein [Nitrosomonas sp. Is35]MDV6347316.1 hypothetical protein [Nitrosomonas sp. Is35]
MTDNDKFHDVVSAYESVKLTKQALKSENEKIDAEITKAKEQLVWLQTAYLPLQDLKDGIIEILAVGAESYEFASIRPGITGLATNAVWSNRSVAYGTPLNYKTLEDALSGKLGDYPACQILTPQKTQFDDRVFLSLLFKTIEPALRDIMERMTPEEFGYGGISPSEIGPGLKERRGMIQSIKARIQELEHKKGANAEKIHALS